MLDTNHPQPPKPRSHWGTVAVIAIGAVLVIVWVSYLRPHMQLDEALHQAGVGQPLPMLELQPLTGTTEGVSLESLHGKVALINYWGPWCGFCVEEFPHLVELWDKNRGNPEFAFVSVSSAGRGEENVPELKDQTENFFKSRQASFPTYVDPDGGNRQILASLTDMNGFGYPTTVLLDRHGIIRALWIGYEPGYSNQMEQLVSKLLSEGEGKKGEGEEGKKTMNDER
jgi:cytochrome c biogenesis protein CcmG, thiol:disulfide interchange protein DsbE